MSKGALYLIPNTIAEDALTSIPPQVIQTLPHIRHFLVEDVRTARRYLSSLKIYSAIEDLHFDTLNKDTGDSEINSMMMPLLNGTNLGVISESGCPGVADPGAKAVKWAHEHVIKVIPLSGPSSILMALMASGLNGQRFAFHGYLPIDAREAAQTIKELESESGKRQQTQIFIETPYRNNSVFQLLLKNLHPDTLLHISLDVTGKGEIIKTQPVRDWQKSSIEWPKLPAVFMFLKT